MLSNLVRAAVRTLCLLAVCLPVAAQSPSIRVTLLGTGSPFPAIDRFGPSTLVEVGDRKFLFDAGRGALQRLAQASVQWRDVQGSRLSQQGVTFVGDDIREGVVYEKDGITISAFEVDHPPVKAFGYRIDHGGCSVVLSGDTAVSTNLIRHAQPADLLVHEVVSTDALSRMGVPAARIAQILGQHVSPEQAGEVFSKVKPRLAVSVYSHVVPPQAVEADLIAPTRKTYDGPVEAGEDLMVIEVGRAIEVRRRAH